MGGGCTFSLLDCIYRAMKCSDTFQCHVKKVVRPAIWSLFNVEKEMWKSPEVYLRQDKKAVNNKPEDEEKADFFQRELHRRLSHLCSALPPAKGTGGVLMNHDSKTPPQFHKETQILAQKGEHCRLLFLFFFFVILFYVSDAYCSRSQRVKLTHLSELRPCETSSNQAVMATKTNNLATEPTGLGKQKKVNSKKKTDNLPDRTLLIFWYYP